MELTWQIKLRIAAASIVGIVLLGILGWQMIEPDKATGVVVLLSGAISVVDVIACAALAFLAGFISYFLCKPYGRGIAVLAAPAGMAVWSLRTGSMTSLLQSGTSVQFRQTAYASLKWESLLWLAILAAGYTGVLVADKLTKRSKQQDGENSKVKLSPASYLVPIASIIVSAVIAQFCIGILAADTTYFDVRFGQIVGQPAAVQIAFAVIVSFAISAFLLKFFLNSSYIWAVISAVPLSFYIMTTYGKENILSYMSASWPASFFPYSGAAVLPIQMVVFGSIGAVIGYWAALRYRHWRSHENKN